MQHTRVHIRGENLPRTWTIDNESVSGRSQLMGNDSLIQSQTTSLPMEFKLHLVTATPLVLASGLVGFYYVIYRYHSAFLLVRDRNTNVRVVHVVVVEEPVVAISVPRVVRIVAATRPEIGTS